MIKTIATFFFSLILLSSIVAPTYMTLIEGSCEVSVVDLGEEEENKKGKESAKELELKIYYSYDISAFYVDLESKKRISFYSKNYTSYQKKLISPPPEQVG